MSSAVSSPTRSSTTSNAPTSCRRWSQPGRSGGRDWPTDSATCERDCQEAGERGGCLTASSYPALAGLAREPLGDSGYPRLSRRPSRRQATLHHRPPAESVAKHPAKGCPGLPSPAPHRRPSRPGGRTGCGEDIGTKCGLPAPERQAGGQAASCQAACPRCRRWQGAAVPGPALPGEALYLAMGGGAFGVRSIRRDLMW
jgi:hypothetical protein